MPALLQPAPQSKGLLLPAWQYPGSLRPAPQIPGVLVRIHARVPLTEALLTELAGNLLTESGEQLFTEEPPL